jgi:8-oxo-dGTP pyrophosphatase MutT (NUDIX family)
MKLHAVQPYVAAFIIFRKNGKVAFLLRENTKWMNGRYGLPAGKVDPDESATAAAIREAKEEVGVDIKPENLQHRLTVFRTTSIESEPTPWMDILFEAVKWEGELYNAEPNVHSELSWLDPDNLPENVTPYVPFFLDQIKAGSRYAEHGWED